MASATLISVSEYLATSYHPDRDFLAGILKERNMGEQPHAQLQMILGRIFGNHRHDWSVRVLAEQRVQISPERFRIPDICILRSADPKDPVVRFAPLLVIEILSRDDSLSELQERVDDYSSLGTRHIWAIDPWKRRAWTASTSGFTLVTSDILAITGSPIEVSLSALFTELDEV